MITLRQATSSGDGVSATVCETPSRSAPPSVITGPTSLPTNRTSVLGIRDSTSHGPYRIKRRYAGVKKNCYLKGLIVFIHINRSVISARRVELCPVHLMLRGFTALDVRGASSRTVPNLSRSIANRKAKKVSYICMKISPPSESNA